MPNELFYLVYFFHELKKTKSVGANSGQQKSMEGVTAEK